MTTLRPADLDQYRAKERPLPQGYPDGQRTLYVPQDDAHGALTAILSSATSSVVLSAFGFADADLAGILDKQLKSPHILCSVTLDQSQAQMKTEAALLKQYSHEMTGNSVAIGSSEHGAYIHRKMVIVDGLILVTGSTNLGDSAERLQDNELTARWDSVLASEARDVLAIAHDHVLKQMAAKRAKEKAA